MKLVEVGIHGVQPWDVADRSELQIDHAEAIHGNLLVRVKVVRRVAYGNACACRGYVILGVLYRAVCDGEGYLVVGGEVEHVVA